MVCLAIRWPRRSAPRRQTNLNDDRWAGRGIIHARNKARNSQRGRHVTTRQSAAFSIAPFNANELIAKIERM